MKKLDGFYNVTGSVALPLVILSIPATVMLGYLGPLIGLGMSVIGLLFAIVGVLKGDRVTKICSWISVAIFIFVMWELFVYVPKHIG
jgi:hypothetical protein